MSYTHEDYLRDCLIEKEGSGRRAMDAGHRKQLWELQRVDLIYKDYPEFKDQETTFSKKGVYEDFFVVIEDKVYTEKSLTEWLDYSEGSELCNLLKNRSSSLKDYNSFHKLYMKEPTDQFGQILDLKAKGILELENKIDDLKKVRNAKVKEVKSNSSFSVEYKNTMSNILFFLTVFIILFILFKILIWDGLFAPFTR